MDKYTESEICRIFKNAHEEQDRVQLLSELTSYPQTHILKILTEHGYEVSEQESNKIAKVGNVYDDEQFLQLYYQGYLDEQIQGILGCSIDTVRGKRKKLNLKTNKRDYTQEKIQFVELYHQGLNDCRIAEILLVSSFTIGKWRNDLGFKPNATRGRKYKKSCLVMG